MPKPLPSPPGQTRRDFLKKTGATTLALAGAGLGPGLLPAKFLGGGEKGDSSIALVLRPDDAVANSTPVQWAAEQLRATLEAKSIPARFHASTETLAPGQTAILISHGKSAVDGEILRAAKVSLIDAPESLALARGQVKGRAMMLAAGSDERGLVYATLELADQVQYAANPRSLFKTLPATSERPANRIRSLSRSFVSDVEDKAWFQDRDFWPPYLTMLAANRFNRFNLAFGLAYDFTTGIRDCYLHFAYPFLLDVPGYRVRALPLPDSERDLNLQMLRYISDETAKRGLHFQLGLWTHAYEWTQSPDANYTIAGLTPADHALYCRDALKMLLQACPAISGVTFRIHGESGVPEGNYDLWKTIFDGAVQCGRRVEIDMHAKGMDQGMIDAAAGTGLPVNISPKFWAEHMGLPYMQGAIRPQEMPPADPHPTGTFKLSAGARQFLRYGYGDLLSEDRHYGVLHRIWPGTQRLLLWGDPQTAAAYGRVSGFCGSAGVELFEPLFFKGRKGSGLPGGRNAYGDLALSPAGGDFEKYRYTYRVWGRSFYNPDGHPEGCLREWRHQFGQGADMAAAALASASRILPLVTTAHCPSAANNTYWPEMYTAIPSVNANRSRLYTDTPSPHRLGTVTSLDPEFFLGLDEFAAELLNTAPGGRTGKYTPAWVAQQLEEHAATALTHLAAAQTKVLDPRAPAFLRLAHDVTIQAGLGRFFAARFRSGVLLAIYSPTGHRPALEQALKANRAARAAWAELAAHANPVYRHDITFGYDQNSRGHWQDRLPALDQDIADMEKLLAETAVSGLTNTKTAESAMKAVLSPLPRPDAARLTGFHRPPPSFKRGQPFVILATLADVKKAPRASRVHLRYRHVNQSETWQSIAMETANKIYRAELPATFTDTPYPIQYHFEIHSSEGVPELYPALQPGYQGQPYFYVRQEV